MKWRLPGPQLPAQAVSRPVSSASAPAAKAARLLVPHVDPIDLALIDGVGDAVQRVADDSITRLHARCLQRFDQEISHSFTHRRNLHIGVAGSNAAAASSPGMALARRRNDWSGESALCQVLIQIAQGQVGHRGARACRGAAHMR
jgi:hypothetical protein